MEAMELYSRAAGTSCSSRREGTLCQARASHSEEQEILAAVWCSSPVTFLNICGLGSYHKVKRAFFGWGVLGFPLHSGVQNASSTMNVDFDAVFGGKSITQESDTSATYFTDDVLRPTLPQQGLKYVAGGQQSGKLLANDLDSSLANLVGNLGFGGTPSKRSDMQWNQPTEKRLTGGTNWQARTSTSTTWNPAPVAPVPQMVPAPMAYPVSTPQVPVYGMGPTQMGTNPLMVPQPILYTQPGIRQTNPFAPLTGAQMQFM